jgi:Zn-dependent M28 family amino/carboxypeptidase
VVAAHAGCGSGGVPEFDSESAFGFLEEQVDIGFRYPGSPEHKELQKYLTGRLREFGANVSLQPFEAVLTTGDTLSLINIIGNYNMGASKRVMLAAHYDTRPYADRDPDPANRDKPIHGANDGASGVAVLLEIARLLEGIDPPVGVDIVLFDGEDYGREGSPIDYCLGSAHFAKRLRGYRPYAAIVIDMIGDSDLEIKMEGYSRAASPALLGELFDIAEELGFDQFSRKNTVAIIDDHLPLIQAGLNAVNLIDFEYEYWHTLEDTPDKCSPESLEAVGNVLLHYIWRQ